MRGAVMKRFLLAIIFLLSLTNFACAEPAKNFSESVENFCWKYFAVREHDKNFLYSPYGIHSALSILANGASGETRKKILDVLEVDNVETLNDGHKNFSAFVKKNYRGENFFVEANLLLVDKKIIGRGFNENFKRVVTADYNSEVRAANFGGDIRGEQKKIHRWVADKTKNFVVNYNSIADANTLTDFANVVCFDGKWATPFKPSQTAEKEFKNCDGSNGTVAMMSNVFKNKIKYRADEKFQAIELPYSANAAMYLILPTDDDALNVAELWNAQTLSYRADFLDALKKSSAFDGEVVVRLPNLTMEYDTFIAEDFIKQGLRRLFTDDAEFFNIVKDTSLKISNARHYCRIDINEQGTKAAAVTEITMVETTAAPDFEPPRQIYFIANRPFLFVIRDVQSGVILFAGAVNKF